MPLRLPRPQLRSRPTGSRPTGPRAAGSRVAGLRAAAHRAVAVRQRPTVVINAVLGVLLLVGALLSYRTVAVADSAPTGTSATRAVAVTLGQVTSTVSASGTVQSASTAGAAF